MANETILRSFPSDKLEAIAIEYFKQQDLSGKTPAEAFDLFQSIYQEIRTHDRELREKRIGEQFSLFNRQLVKFHFHSPPRSFSLLHALSTTIPL